MNAYLIALGPVAAARQLYREGEGHNANPFPKGSQQHEQFMLEMGRCQDEELKRMMQEVYCG
jgi:hypothetical protein